jgi:hypothetical protein
MKVCQSRKLTPKLCTERQTNEVYAVNMGSQGGAIWVYKENRDRGCSRFVPQSHVGLANGPLMTSPPKLVSQTDLGYIHGHRSWLSMMDPSAKDRTILCMQ